MKIIARHIIIKPNKNGALGAWMYKGIMTKGEIICPIGITMPKKPLAAPWCAFPTDRDREAEIPGPNIPAPIPYTNKGI